MRVALLTSLPDPNRMSMVLYDSMLCRYLKSEFIYEAEVFLFPDKKKFPGGPKWKRYFEQYWAYPAALKNLDADIYHITDHGFANLVPAVKKGKAVVTFHDALLPNLQRGTIPVEMKPHSSIWAQRYSLSCMESAAAVIAVSEFSRRELLEYSRVPEEKMVTVHEGVGEEFFRAASEEEKSVFRAKWKVPQDRKIILLPGRTEPHKNIEGAIRAFKSLNSQYHTQALLLKTGTALTAPQRALARELGIEQDILELGALPAEDMPLVYQISDALLFLSFYEGFGLPVLEAMASGVPAVISGCAALAETGGDAALTAGPQNPALAAESLYRVLEDIPFRQTLVEKGKKRAAQFTWQETAKKTMAVYRKVLFL